MYCLYFQESLTMLLKQLEKEKRSLESQVKGNAQREEQELKVCFYSTQRNSLETATIFSALSTDPLYNYRKILRKRFPTLL